MARKRLVAPEFFTHGELYDAEASSGLPLRLAFAGLWTASDRRGVFAWQPRVLKLAILPYDPVDFNAVLAALERAGFIERYVVDGKEYGSIPSFAKWQTFHPHEKASKLPGPPALPTEPTIVRPEPDNVGTDHSVAVAVTVTAPITVADTVCETGQPPTDSSASAKDEPPAHRSPPELVDEFLREHDFGPFRDAVEGLIRSARMPIAIIGIMRMHLASENGYEPASPLEMGRACQEYVVRGEEFKANLFAGFIRSAKKSTQRTENRRRNTVEQRHIDSEQQRKQSEDAEEAAAEREIERFATARPERYAELTRAAEAEVPRTITFGRDIMVRAKLAAMVRGERQRVSA